MHARAVGVEDADDLDVEAELAIVVEEQCFGAALAFVVAGANADRVDLAPVAFGLRVLFRVAIDFAGRGLQDARLDSLGQPEHVDGAMHAGLGRLHRVELVMHRRCGAGQVVYLADFDIQRKGYVMAHQFKLRIADQVRDVALWCR